MTTGKSPEQRLFRPMVAAAVASIAAMIGMGVTALLRSHGTGTVLVFAGAFAVMAGLTAVLIRHRRSKTWPGTNLTR